MSQFPLCPILLRGLLEISQGLPVIGVVPVLWESLGHPKDSLYLELSQCPVGPSVLFVPESHGDSLGYPRGFHSFDLFQFGGSHWNIHRTPSTWKRSRVPSVPYFHGDSLGYSRNSHSLELSHFCGSPWDIPGVPTHLICFSLVGVIGTSIGLPLLGNVPGSPLSHTFMGTPWDIPGTPIHRNCPTFVGVHGISQGFTLPGVVAVSCLSHSPMGTPWVMPGIPGGTNRTRTTQRSGTPWIIPRSVQESLKYSKGSHLVELSQFLV